MIWAMWVLIGWLAFGAIASILLVGKPRKPITPGVAVANLIVAVVLILLVVLAAS